MNVEKIKLTARKHEQREEWRKAIDVYLKAIDAFERDAVPPDLALYNKVGDLHMKVNNTGAAVQSYERAAKLYQDQGLVNNAIALCGKILRVNPGKSSTYLMLAGLHAEKNVVAEARRCLIEYLERMNAQGNRQQALKDISDYADRYLGNADVREMLSDLLEALSQSGESQEQLRQVAAKLESVDTDAAASGETQAREVPGLTGDLIFLDTGSDYGYQQSSAAEIASSGAAENDRVAETEEDLELAATTEEPAELDSEAAPGGLMVDPAGDLDPVSGTSQDSDLTIEHTVDDAAAADVDLAAAEGEEDDELELVSAGPSGLVSEQSLDFEADSEPEEDDAQAETDTDSPAEEAPHHETGELPPALDREIARAPGEAPASEAAASVAPQEEPAEQPAESSAAQVAAADDEPAGEPSIEDLEDRILDDPDNPQYHRDLGEALIASGDTGRGMEELELALGRYEALEDWGHASDVNVELLRLKPNNISYYQKRVELAFRMGDRGRLIESYLALGDVLVRVDAVAKARAVYGRVLEHDPQNTLAQAALEALEPDDQPPAAPAPPAARASVSVAPAPVTQGGDFVNLGQELLEPEQPKDARMRLSRTQPTGDEAQDFAEILQAFKQGIEETIEVEDFQSHYDLGIAFKEMGLLDEAIAEFQKALRVPEGRLRTSEALGVSFFEKGQFPVSEAILRRAVDSLPGGDDEKIGLLYWLGRAREEQGKSAEALGCYQRAMAVDIKFQDAAERTQRMEATQ